MTAKCEDGGVSGSGGEWLRASMPSLSMPPSQHIKVTNLESPPNLVRIFY